VAIVAGFDCYRKPKQARDFPWAHTQAQKIEKKLVQQAEKLTSAENAYIHYCQKALQKTVQAPSYKGRSRVIFETIHEQGLYNACYLMKEREAQILKEKTKLCSRLYFYTVSLHHNEPWNSEDALFLSIPQQFRERWGTENGFNGLKHRFPLITNDRSPTARHVRWILSSLLENGWHYTRILYRFHHSSPNTSSRFYMGGSLPEMRKTFEAQFPPKLTAQGYLLSNLWLTLNKCLEKNFPTIIKC